MGKDRDERVARPGRPRTELAAEAEPPVVARLVVEIRSDGSRIVARGAMEDVPAGQRVAMEAEGATPLAFAAALARAIFQAPSVARAAARALLPGKRGPKK